MVRHRRQTIGRRGHWLCIAYAFPPINRSGTHRTLGFVRHLDRSGWDATVLTVRPDGESTDEHLNTLIPSSTRVTRTDWNDLIAWIKQHLPRARSGTGEKQVTAAVDGSTTPATARNACARFAGMFKEWGSRLLMTPDSRIGWIIPGVRAGMKSIRQRRPDVIYSTSPYMSAHLIAMVVSTFTRIPWVADFRDPWRDNPFRELGFRTLETWDGWLEWLVLRRATHVICNTPTMRQALIKRRPFVQGKCSTILNGFDADLEPQPPRQAKPSSDRTFTLLHCGNFYGRRSPRIWLAALRRAIELDPAGTVGLRMVFVGAEDYDGTPLRTIAASEGIADHVQVNGICTHAEAIAHMRASDALILAGTSGDAAELQIPNKLYEYLSLRKPILATATTNSPILPVLIQAKAQAMICSPNDTTTLAHGMIRLIHRDRPFPDGLQEVWGDWSGVDRFRRTRRADELRTIFSRLTGVIAQAGPRVLRSAETARPAKDKADRDTASTPSLLESLR